MSLTAYLVLTIVVLTTIVVIQWFSFHVTVKGYIQTILRLGCLLGNKTKEIECLEKMRECDDKLRKLEDVMVYKTLDDVPIGTLMGIAGGSVPYKPNSKIECKCEDWGLTEPNIKTDNCPKHKGKLYNVATGKYDDKPEFEGGKEGPMCRNHNIDPGDTGVA